MITGFIEPTEGTIKVNGYDVLSQPAKAKKQIGYMPEGVPLAGAVDTRRLQQGIGDLLHKLLHQIQPQRHEPGDIAKEQIGRPAIGAPGDQSHVFIAWLQVQPSRKQCAAERAVAQHRQPQQGRQIGKKQQRPDGPELFHSSMPCTTPSSRRRKRARAFAPVSTTS